MKVVVVLFLSLALSYMAWPLVSPLTSKGIQPIASAVSTIAGILFGFVMASFTLLASAKSNTLVKNTQLTGYFGKLLNKLHLTMGALLFVCILFLLILFFPDSKTLKFFESGSEFRISVLLLELGIFLLINSFYLFFSTWLEFKRFSENM